MTKKKRQFGLWDSPLSEEMLACAGRLSDVQWAGDGQTLVWLESRDGRGVLMVRRPGQAPRPINDRCNIRGGVGYGGGEFCVQGEQVIFADRDGRLFRADLNSGVPKPITPKWGKAASPAISPNGEWVAYVHRHDDEDRIAVVDTNGECWPTIVAQGADFYMQPAWHPSGERLIWVRWDHPQMPWNGTFLETRELSFDDKGSVELGQREVLTGAEDVAYQQPTYSPDGATLAYLSDRSGYWQIYLRDLDSGDEISPSEEGREYGGPPWVQGLRYYEWSADSTSLVATTTSEGVARLERVGVDGEIHVYAQLGDYTAMRQVALSRGDTAALIAGSSSIPARVISFDVDEGVRVEAFSSSERLDERELSKVRPVSWPVDDAGPVDTVYGLYYPPTNPRFEGVGRPPAMVMIHGGPTSQRLAQYEARNQFFATRGFAVLDVNYRGSTGYGRDYMEALFGQWGVADVEDAVGGAHFLVDQGLADPDKLVIMGGSAGGYTVLQTLAQRPGEFKAGVCLYGISDLFALQMGTHKFEAYYNDSLIGPLPEAAEKYRQRSPIFSADAIEDKLAVYHGAKDEVVPLDQAEAIVNSLRRRGVDHLYHVYEEEGHGWRKSETIVHFHRSVLQFLTKHVLFG